MFYNVISELTRQYVYKLAESGKRRDGRVLDQFRDITVQTGVIGTAEGSARVRLGKTEIVVGIKMQPGEPYPDSPDQGVMTTNLELIPMASPYIEPGPPGAEAIEMARVIDRGIRESGTIPLSDLVITPGEKVWVLFIDIHVLDYDGNLFDAGTIGVIKALENTVVPAKDYEVGEENFPLKIRNIPISTTFVKLGKVIAVDPTAEEESVATSRLTITTDLNGDLRAMQKGIGGGFTLEEVEACIEKSIRFGKQLRSLLWEKPEDVVTPKEG
ncbi:MAG: exosome complex protein Rrp42 [Thermoplasmata archaeon]|nr:exosome complex protein Rrp42 [Thermoplasmata archaeon]